MSLSNKQIAEIILNTSLFCNLSEENRLQVALKMQEKTFNPKKNIVHVGELGDSLYLIVKGLVEILGNDYITGEEFLLAHLGPGDCFGEMSLLTGEKRSATVRAFEKTTVLQLDRNSFDEIMLNSAQMGLSISRILAERLAKLNQKLEELKGQQTVINKMFSSEMDITSEIAVIGRSNIIKALMQKIEDVSNSCGLWALKGPDGSGKRSIARLIHRSGCRIGQTFLVLDCNNLSKEEQRRKLYGDEKKPGYIKLAKTGTLILINAYKLSPDILGELLKLNKKKIDRSEMKSHSLIINIYTDKDSIVEMRFPTERIIEVPPLNSRKQDIPIIAKKIIERLDKTGTSRPTRLSNEALARLLEYNWPNNLSELESVLEQSLVLSKDSIITEDKIIFDLPAAMQDPYLESVKSLAIALDAKDSYTAGHSERVARYSKEIAKSMELPDEFINNLYTMALFHDVGKIGVSENILRKQTHLTEEEYLQIQKHPESSKRILQPLTKYIKDLESVLHHHTHYDGTGYPGGLSGESIPLGARIISVADTFDAMTTDRPYRKSMPIEMAKAELKRVAGKQLDPNVISTLIKIIENNKVIKS